MECTLKKQCICSKESLGDFECELPIEAKFSMPEYCNPIKRVLNISVTPSVSSKSISGNVLNIDGLGGVKLIYLDDNDTLNSFETAFVFSKNQEFNFELENTLIDVMVSADKVANKLTGERSVEISGELTLKTKITLIKYFDCIDPSDDKQFEFKTQNISVCDSILFSEKNVIIEEDIELSESHAKIGKILNYCCKVLEQDCKIMSNKVMLKGSLLLKVTYLSADDYSSCHFEQKIPYSQICDIDGIDETYSCTTKANIVFSELKCRNGGYEDSRSVLFNAKLRIMAEACREKNIEIVQDIYSFDYDLEVEENDIHKNIIVDRICDSFIARKSIEFSGGAVSSVMDINANAVVTGRKINGDMLSVFGTAIINLIMLDNDGAINSHERSIDFEYSCKLAESNSQIITEENIEIVNTSYIIKSDSELEIICELNVCINITSNNQIKVVANAIPKKESEQTTDCCSINICYLSEATDIWSLAKKYKSRVSKIREINAIDSNSNTVSGAILIPIK